MNRAEFIGCILGTPIFVQMIQQNPTSEILMGRGSPDLVGESYSLTRAAATAFEQMKAQALQDGISLEVVSSYRSFADQLRIWNRKYEKFKQEGLQGRAIIDAITEYSTLPGTSRHHWGTEVDLIDAAPPKEGDVLLTEKFYAGGPYEKLRLWLEENAHAFGFIKPYTSDPNRKGFAYEPWHYSYAPESIPFLKAFLKIPLEKFGSHAELRGQQYLNLNYLQTYLNNYVLGIAEELR